MTAVERIWNSFGRHVGGAPAALQPPFRAKILALAATCAYVRRSKTGGGHTAAIRVLA
ncbi:MAG: hypothetical protein ACOVQ0_05970 [Novosphingobium sp.]|uniref:hypothetical protein n=1 Tax=Novosphingobium sp. TaxID=1874826 RepID=UPI003B9907A3